MSGRQTAGRNRNAVAWWVEKSDNETDVCFDLDTGETISIRVTDASFGGVVE